jgi:hypothetical protein
MSSSEIRGYDGRILNRNCKAERYDILGNWILFILQLFFGPPMGQAVLSETSRAGIPLSCQWGFSGIPQWAFSLTLGIAIQTPRLIIPVLGVYREMARPRSPLRREEVEQLWV